MSEIHEFKCDNCLIKVTALWNGENYVSPKGWVQLYDMTEGEFLDLHTCNKCFKDPRKKIKKIIRNKNEN